MKYAIKHKLFRLGIFNALDMIRRLPEIRRWIVQGCTGGAPPPIKRKIIAAYRSRYGLTRFIETGTYLGDTLAYMATDPSVNCTSIELDGNYYQAATRRFASYRNVTLLQGDSGQVLPDILRQLQTPTLFWLDGHYSGSGTAKGDINTPVSAELKAILDSPIKGHVILIDDARCFNGTCDYPYLDVLLKSIRIHGEYHPDVSADIIRLEPDK